MNKLNVPASFAIPRGCRCKNKRLERLIYRSAKKTKVVTVLIEEQ
jgi:hypothetical protein